MARSVVVLRETERVGDIIALLKRTKHNGFPVVDPGRHQRCTFFAGLILRRQLLVLLHERVWEAQAKGEWMAKESRNRFVDCRGRWMEKETHSAYVDELTHTNEVIAALKLSDADKAATIDLRPFMDPSPYVVNELMQLRRVYRLFNEIGVRHLAVVDCREQVVGMITRKDILPEIIEHRVMSEQGLHDVKQLLHQKDAPKRRPSFMKHPEECGRVSMSAADNVSATSYHEKNMAARNRNMSGDL